ncbi:MULTISPECIES: epoxide hydrolase family protein [Rhodomicrobium]|nr:MULTISPECIES: epoxide hydrolase [Rhodomicrobium]
MTIYPPTNVAPLSRRSVLKGAGALAALAGVMVGSDAARSAAQMDLGPADSDAGLAPFRVEFPPDAIADLHERLMLTRWPERETVADWSQGVPLARMRELVEYWGSRYDFGRLERRINAFRQFRTEIDELGIHFIHARSHHKSALPLLITHGWPGSIVEFLNIIGPLIDPTAYGGAASDAFHVIAPSLPGFAFSDKPKQAGWKVPRIARAWAALMQRLGYDRWVAQGGDWGAGVTSALGHMKPQGLAGIHLNWAFVFPAALPGEGLSTEEQRAIDAAEHFRTDGFGYFQQQGTRPQTVGYPLADSPVGHAAWIYEKFQAWTDNDGVVESAISRDEILDNITLYWLTNTAASSARIYWENYPASFAGGTIEIPVGISVFPKELFRVPRSWAMASYPQLIHFNELSKGGHFAALEQPAVFVNELRSCFAKLR